MDDDLIIEKQDIKHIQRYANKFSLLTTAEERELTTKLVNYRLIGEFEFLPTQVLYGIRTEFRRLKDELITKNLRLVLKECQKPSYTGRGLTIFDLFMEGYDGLDYAAGVKYDPYLISKKTFRTTKFSTSAVIWIKQRIGRAIEKKGSSVKIPGHIQSIKSKIRQVVRIFVKENQARPGPETICELVKAKYPDAVGIAELTPEKVSEYGRLDWISSLDETSDTEDGNSSSLGSYLAATEHHQPEVEVEDLDRKEQVQKALKDLDDNERFIVTYHFGLLDYQERSLKQIARLLKISNKDCQVLYESAVLKLKGNTSLSELL